MNLSIFSCGILPLWGALYALYFILRRAGLARESLVAKCAGSFLAVSSAGTALYLGGENPLAQTVFWFFVLCTIADALLEIQFVAGLFVFGAAHVCLLVWLWGVTPPSWWSLLLWVIFCGGGALLFRRELPTMGMLVVPACLYVGILSAVAALALPLPFLADSRFWPLSLGALCFFISDMMVAKGEFGRWRRPPQKTIMLLYWVALYLISAPLWLL